jgi:hypothetical protein
MYELDFSSSESSEEGGLLRRVRRSSFDVSLAMRSDLVRKSAARHPPDGGGVMWIRGSCGCGSGKPLGVEMEEGSEANEDRRL